MKHYIYIILLLLLTSCATILKDSGVYGDSSLNNNNLGYVVLYRKFNFAACAQTFIVTIDDRDIAALKVNDYCVYPLAEGTHKIKVDFSMNAKPAFTTIDIKRGEVIFLKIYIPIFYMDVAVVDSATALKEMASMSPIRDVDREFIASYKAGGVIGLKNRRSLYHLTPRGMIALNIILAQFSLFPLRRSLLPGVIFPKRLRWEMTSAFMVLMIS